MAALRCELIKAKIGDQWIVDIWQKNERTIKVRVRSYYFFRMEIELSKDLFDDEKFDTVGYVVDEFERTMGKKT